MINKNFIKAAELFKQYAQVGKSNSSAEPAKEYISKRIPEDIQSWGIGEPIYKIKGTVGQGRTVEVPWVAVMRKSITTSPRRGVYIVYLFSADMKRVYLSLNMGCDYFSGMGRGKSVAIRKISHKISQMIEIPDRFTTEPIRLDGRYSTNKEYEYAHIIGMEYNLDNMPSPAKMKEDLSVMLSVYERVALLMGNRRIEEFYDYVDALADGLIISDEDHFSTDTVNSASNVDSAKTQDEGHGKKAQYIDVPEKKRRAVRNEKGEIRYPRSEKKASDALELAGYRCEFDDCHFSFYSKKNQKRMYVEAHHLIPLSRYAAFSTSLDVIANIVALCPNCHRCIHNGSKKERDVIVTRLYEQRKNRLEKSGISIMLADLLDSLT